MVVVYLKRQLCSGKSSILHCKALSSSGDPKFKRLCYGCLGYNSILHRKLYLYSDIVHRGIALN